MRFLIDAQLPPALARLLASHGHAAEHVADISLRDADDSPIWRYALENGAILVTKDEDFPHRLRQGGAAPVVLWLRIGNTNRRARSSGSSRSCHRLNPWSAKASAFLRCADRDCNSSGASRLEIDFPVS